MCPLFKVLSRVETLLWKESSFRCPLGRAGASRSHLRPVHPDSAQTAFFPSLQQLPPWGVWGGPSLLDFQEITRSLPPNPLIPKLSHHTPAHTHNTHTHNQVTAMGGNEPVPPHEVWALILLGHSVQCPEEDHQ